MNRQAKAEVAQLRQQTQYTCCATSIAAALRAHGKNVSEDDVNQVLNASPMAGASWEAMLATVQYFGCRGTLVVPATPRMLKSWTDAGVPVVIAWNPEGRPWSHASTVYDVVEGEDGKLTIYIMDPNIPNPTQTTRIVGEDEFCQKWGEKVSESLIVRRPAMAIEREITTDGRQVMASTRTAAGYYTRERRQEINHGSVTREEAQQEWAERMRYERSGQRQIDETVRWADEARRRLLRPWDRVIGWFRQYGNARQRDLAAWTSALTLGRARSTEEAARYQEEIKTLQDIYDHPSGKGRELFEEVQRVLNLPTPLTPPPHGSEKNLGVSGDAELVETWERVVAYRSNLKEDMNELDRNMTARLNRAVQALPNDLRAGAESMTPSVKVEVADYGRFEPIGMLINEVGGYPEDIPGNFYTVVGYPIRCTVQVGVSHLGGWEAHFLFGVFPHLERSPQPRLLHASVRYGREHTKIVEPLETWGGRSLYPWPIAGGAAVRGNSETTSTSITMANYDRSKTLSQSLNVIEEVFDTLPDALVVSAAVLAEKQAEEARREAEHRRQAEEYRRRQEEARRQEEEAKRQKEEARRQREQARAQAAPAAPKTVVDSALAEKFAILDRLISGGYAQARDIAQEVKSVYEAGGKPTEDQLKALRNMMYRSRMRAEADHFRVASSDLEAVWWGGDAVTHTAKVTDTVKIKKEDLPAHRHGPQYVQDVMRRPGAGTHHTRTKDVAEGRSRKEKHKKNLSDREAGELAAAWGIDGEDI